MSLGIGKKVYSIILEKQVKDEIDKIAKTRDRSSSSFINQILKKYIKVYNINSSLNKVTNEDINSNISLLKEELNRSLDVESPDDVTGICFWRNFGK